jgi:hypothetical protein
MAYKDELKEIRRIVRHIKKQSKKDVTRAYIDDMAADKADKNTVKKVKTIK